MKIEITTKVTDELVSALQMLIPQLTDDYYDITHKSLEAIVMREGTFLFLARNKDNKIVGALTLIVFSIPTGKKAFIEDVVVDKEVQGQGFGFRLMAAAIEQARKENAAKIELSSNPKRMAANTMYQKMGFKVRETNFYRLEPKKE